MRCGTSLSVLLLFLFGQYALGETFRVTILTPRMLRLQYDAHGIEEHEPTDGLPAKWYEKGEFMYLETGALTVRYQLDGEIRPEAQSADVLHISFPLGQHKVIWYPGKDDALNLKGLLPEHRDSILADPRLDLLPGLVSRAGWSIVPLAPSTPTSFDWLFLAYGLDYEQAIRDFKATPFYQKITLPLATLINHPLHLPHLVATASNVGASYYGLSWDDTLRTDPLSIRLRQLSAFLPEAPCDLSDSLIVQRLDSLNDSRALRRAFDLQRSLRPYKDSIQALGFNLCRPLYYDFPTDNNAYIYEDEFLCGNRLLVAPVMQPASEDGLSRRTVWLPEGLWMDVVNHRLQQGPTLIQVECSPLDIPYFWFQDKP